MVNDETAPTAMVSVPATSGLGIPVSWAGSDTESGIRHYEVEVKEAGGSWTDWLTETTASQGTFIGTIGMTYTFQVRATDNVDNVSGWVESDEVGVYSVKKYYAFGGSKVAMRQGDVVYYLSGDHLGSTSLTTDENGDIVSEVRYLPYGEERWTSGATPTDFTFTGQRNEAGFGLMDYNARYYSARLGRFVSPDSIVPEPMSAGGFNRYRYVKNNPLKHVDPTGHYNVDSDTGECFGGDCDHYIGYKDFDSKTLSGRVQEIYDYGQKQISDSKFTSYQKFRNTIQFASSLYGSDEVGQLMNDLTLVLYGHQYDGTDFFKTSQYNPSGDPNFLGIDAFSRGCSGNTCDTGFAERFRDASGNQPFHFWFYVATSYFDAPEISWAGNFIHDGYSTWAGTALWYHPVNQVLRLSGRIHLDEYGTSADYALGVGGATLGKNIGWWERQISYGLRNENIGDLIVNWLDANIAAK